MGRSDVTQDEGGRIQLKRGNTPQGATGVQDETSAELRAGPDMTDESREAGSQPSSAPPAAMDQSAQATRASYGGLEGILAQAGISSAPASAPGAEKAPVQRKALPGSISSSAGPIQLQVDPLDAYTPMIGAFWKVRSQIRHDVKTGKNMGGARAERAQAVGEQFEAWWQAHFAHFGLDGDPWKVLNRKDLEDYKQDALDELAGIIHDANLIFTGEQGQGIPVYVYGNLADTHGDAIIQIARGSRGRSAPGTLVRHLHEGGDANSNILFIDDGANLKILGHVGFHMDGDMNGGQRGQVAGINDRADLGLDRFTKYTLQANNTLKAG